MTWLQGHPTSYKKFYIVVHPIPAQNGLWEGFATVSGGFTQPFGVNSVEETKDEAVATAMVRAKAAVDSIVAQVQPFQVRFNRRGMFYFYFPATKRTVPIPDGEYEQIRDIFTFGKLQMWVLYQSEIGRNPAHKIIMEQGFKEIASSPEYIQNTLDTIANPLPLTY